MGYFVFEGVDGVGKTTVMKEVALELALRGKKFILTKEPGGPKALIEEWQSLDGLEANIGFQYEGFRPLCVNSPHIPQLVKRALYLADSFYNWEKVILPALADGCIVLSDRSWISDLAYGKALTGRSFDELRQFNNALLPAREKATNGIYLWAHSDIREARLKRAMADEMDKLGKDKRNEIADNYVYLFDMFLDINFKMFSTMQSSKKVGMQVVNWILSQ